MVGVILSGCASPVVEGGHIARNRSIVIDNVGLANRGDRVARFIAPTRRPVGCVRRPFNDMRLRYTRSAKSILAMSSTGFEWRHASPRELPERARTNLWHTLALATVHGIMEAGPKTAAPWNAMSPEQKAATWKLMDAGLRATCRWEDAILSKRPLGG